LHPVVFLLISVLLGVVGQLLLKAGASQVGPLGLGPLQPLGVARRLVGTPLIWAGLGIYGAGTLFWLIALSRVELGYAYPFLSLSYVMIVACSWLLLGESVSRRRLLGVAAICCGVAVVAGGYQ
jgi:multidrug transporter EmrE-like cation transporter